MNLKVIYDLPYATHCYLIEALTDGNHAKKLVYSRYIKFLKSVSSNRRPMLTGLLNSVMGSCQSIVGQNIRTILLDTDVNIVPGITNPSALRNYRVYEAPSGDEWKIGMLISLLEIKDSRWAVQFDEETMKICDDDVATMINSVCVDK